MRPGKFIGKLYTVSVADGWERIIQIPERPFYYLTSYGRKIAPQHNFLTDLGSVPRFLWVFLPPHYLKPCVVCHDWDYDSQTVPRLQADYDLREMIYTYTGGNALIRRNLYLLATRGGGWYAWSKDDNVGLYLKRKNKQANHHT